jgi:hypothetical protein
MLESSRAGDRRARRDSEHLPRAREEGARDGAAVGEVLSLHAESLFRFLPPFVLMLESQHLLDVQSIFARTAVPDDLLDQHRDLWHWRIHAVEEA